MNPLSSLLFSSLIVGNHNESDRIAWVEKTLKKVPNRSRILDAGAGELRYKKFCQHLEYVSQDFNQYNPKKLQVGLQTDKWDYSRIDIVSDICKIPQPDKSFDAVICTEVFEHIPNPILALKEFSRLLKPSGYLILTAPFCSLTHFAPYHFSTGFNRFYYEEHLADCGFEILEISPNGNYFEYIAQELRRTPEMALQYTTSKLHLFEKGAMIILLNLLRRLSKKDKRSNELLCFGYHIFAKKIS